MKVLNARETRKIELLASIVRANDSGRQPNKRNIIGYPPRRTESRQYRMIDDLIRRGLVRNAGTTRGYRLEATEAGRNELR